MTVQCAWLRLYACIVAETEEEFFKAYCYESGQHAQSGLWEYVTEQRQYWGKAEDTKRKEKYNERH